MTQERVVEMAGINPEYLGEIQRRENNPTELSIYKLFRVLKVSVTDILPWEWDL